LFTSPQEPAGQVVKFGMQPGVEPQTPGEMQTSPGEQQTVEHGVPGMVAGVQVPVPPATTQVTVWHGPVGTQGSKPSPPVGQQEPSVRHKPSQSGPAQHTVGPSGTVGAHVPFGQHVPSSHGVVAQQIDGFPGMHVSVPAQQVAPAPVPQVSPTTSPARQHCPSVRQTSPHCRASAQQTVASLAVVGRQAPFGQHVPSSHSGVAQQAGVPLLS